MKGISTQRVFTIITDIRPGDEAAIEETLKTDPFDFNEFAMLHFACFVIFPAKKLELPKSKLVLECNIDGSEDAFLDQLARSPRLADIYSHCECFHDATTPREYLCNHLRWPQLSHVGAPYRSVQSIKDDDRICGDYANRVKGVAARELGSAMRRSPSGMAEWWNWELIKPWLAWVLFLLAVVAALDWKFSLERNLERNLDHGFDRWLLILFHAIVFVFSALAAPKLWLTSRPELRRPVTLPALIAVGVAVAVVVVASGRASTHRLSASFIAVGTGFIVAAVGLAWCLVRNQKVRWRNVRLAAMRIAESGSSPMAPFEGVPINDGHLSPRPGLREWFQRWWPWLVLLVTAWVIFRFAWPYKNSLTIGLTALGFLEALWIATLCGWPEDGCWTRWHPAVIAYIAGVTLGSFLLIKFQLLTWGNSEWVKAPLLVIVTVAAFLGAWGWLLPTPAAAPNRVPREELARLVDQEDCDVQNHMAAVVALPPHWFRTGSIKFFLSILSAFFFRSWLPDLFRGKLFGVPTVHFCQWVLIDDRNYLFFSNYDHSWNAYLDDFGATIATGLQKIWGQGVNNPGFADVEEFKRYARSTMVPHQQWYPAYRGLSLRQIWNNEQIRRRAATARSEEQTLEVLRRCGAAPKTLPDFFHARIR